MKINLLNISLDGLRNESAILMEGVHKGNKYRNAYLIRYDEIGSIEKTREGVSVLCDWFLRKEKEADEIHNRD